MSDKTKTGGLWMWGLTTTIIVFVLFFIGFAVWTFQDDVELVYDNYYEKDVVFEQQIKRVARTQALPIKPTLTYDHTREILDVTFPLALGHSPSEGKVLMFRPANLHQDRTFPLTLVGDSLQTIELPEMDPGLWRIKLSWTSGGEEYYLEQALMVQ